MSTADGKREIVICLGSSCFSRGNKETLQAINKYLSEHGLTESVFFHGAHCCGKCDKGPMIRIDDKEYQYVDADSVLDVLINEFE